MSLMKYCWMLEDARVIAFTVTELLRENQQVNQEITNGYEGHYTTGCVPDYPFGKLYI